MENNSLKHVDASENVRCIIDNASLLTESEQAGKGSIYELKNINWTTCEDFTIEIGKEQIKEYIGTWELHPSWLFSIEFQELKDIEFHKEYHYQICWSIPTWCTPIPKATAIFLWRCTIMWNPTVLDTDLEKHASVKNG
ncbi:A-kinase anchor protein 14 isoform X2 [Paramormyrops kingsleyae]|uniref:A-kinase anchor protein 14 isoform X2 n=1 Tax=Paramormyrops kingsleyae TaxID=1676925 RepID=UPI000CD5F3B6|nr:A-kinase anchor protein 14 isoform X3 [Paramormyrops kingsleyae]